MPDTQPASPAARPQTHIGEWIAAVAITAIALFFRCSDLQ